MTPKKSIPLLDSDLVITSDEEALSFNVSHSCGLALYAVARGREVGIDLERIRADFAGEQIAERFFSPQENTMLRALPAKRAKQKAFFNCWTRKRSPVGRSRS
jgi:4'-phosphopantetheinyl transferase